MARKKQVTIKSGGLGTIIDNVTEATGIKKLVEIFVDGKDCKCVERKEALNKLFPKRFKARCFTEQEYKDYSKFVKERTIRLSSQQVKYVCELHSIIFNVSLWYPCTTCSPKPLIQMIDKLDKVYETYEN